MTTKIKDLFGYPAVDILDKPQFVCGVEYEIESILDHGYVNGKDGIVVTTDHSLRNNGFEYKTGPATYDKTVELFQFLHKNLKIKRPEQQFSERTSIHVHVNCRFMALDTMRQLVLTYALLEPLFFSFVGDKRKNNIFCVPLNYTSLPERYKDPIDVLHKYWQKYTAFNLMPLGPNKDTAALGTVEYRHLYGTKDEIIFTTWLNSLKMFHEWFIHQPQFNIVESLEQGEDPVKLAKQIVPLFCQGKSDLYIRELIKDSVIDVKLAKGYLAK